ncbi:putative metal-dependent hydrolase [Xylanibacillus composti]|uniref:Putative metal-dependent hydrolase YfiT n=1 Tax=Xylanibacillus composti TaxID=1572762 RepID=A0A8J4M0V3_9BACL|nr:putative metal-dependent hydrolase [Xylanibacillus composti]MDT9726824.1 putative metal-dependent hydrolase [Xylanibacillus composti]GIQ67192.1 putative metal-dependent hydrolase YfiT [Xylanibacillus composti]
MNLLSENAVYPIGEFQPQESVSQGDVRAWIGEIQSTPVNTRNLLEGLPQARLDKRIRDNAWSIRQLVHHLADAAMNSYIHFKLALSEDNPTIKPYDEEAWNMQADEGSRDMADSLLLLQAICNRWTVLMRSMTAEQFERTFVHPVAGERNLAHYLDFCIWHIRHHTAQIEASLHT